MPKQAILTITSSVIAVIVLAGCAAPSPAHAPAERGRTIDQVERAGWSAAPEPRGTILALGGGGVRGFAHIGVLRALEEYQIPVEAVVGTSVGAVVGAAFAAGMNSADMQEMALRLRPAGLADWQLSSRGLLRGERIRTWAGSLARDLPIESLPRGYAAVATDLRTGEAVLLDRGSVGDAVRASVAVPGMMAPVTRGDQVLADGGIRSLVPVRFARAMGARYVVAVDVFCGMESGLSDSMAAVLQRAFWIQSCALSSPEMAQADLAIRVTMNLKSMRSFDEALAMIEAGYQAARQVLDSNPTLVRDMRDVAKRATARPAWTCCTCFAGWTHCEAVENILKARDRPRGSMASTQR